LEPRELAEKIAYLLLEKEFLLDHQIQNYFHVDDFEVIKAKNILCRYYGIAYEKLHPVEEENQQALFLFEEYAGDDAIEKIYRVFHDPTFKTRKRLREEQRKNQLKGEVEEIYQKLKEEWQGT
jgi:hypothetical protein